MKTILPIMPLVIAISMAKLATKIELSVVFFYSGIVATTFVQIFLSLIVSAIFIALIGKISPVPCLKKICRSASCRLVVAHAVPVCRKCLTSAQKKFGMEEKLSMFVVPVGLQFNALGSGSYVITVAILMRITVGLPIDMEFMLSFFFVALFMAFTFPAVPSATILVMTSIFAVAGVLVTAVTLFIDIDLLVDGMRTSSNAVGILGSTFLLARLEDKINKTIYDTE